MGDKPGLRTKHFASGEYAHTLQSVFCQVYLWSDTFWGHNREFRWDNSDETLPVCCKIETFARSCYIQPQYTYIQCVINGGVKTTNREPFIETSRFMFNVPSLYPRFRILILNYFLRFRISNLDISCAPKYQVKQNKQQRVYVSHRDRAQCENNKKCTFTLRIKLSLWLYEMTLTREKPLDYVNIKTQH